MICKISAKKRLAINFLFLVTLMKILFLFLTSALQDNKNPGIMLAITPSRIILFDKVMLDDIITIYYNIL